MSDKPFPTCANCGSYAGDDSVLISSTETKICKVETTTAFHTCSKPEPQSSSLTFNDGITAMTRHSLAAVKLVESGRWTVVRMKEWLTACLTQDIKFLTDELKASLYSNPITETNSGLDEIAVKLYEKLNYDEAQPDGVLEYKKWSIDLIKQAILFATEQLRKEKEGFIANMPKCGACAEGTFCGSVMQPHDKDCVYSERDLAQQRLVKLAKSVVNDGTINEYGIVGYRFLSIEILSGNFETIDKMV